MCLTCTTSSPEAPEYTIDCDGRSRCRLRAARWSMWSSHPSAVGDRASTLTIMSDDPGRGRRS